MTSSRRPSLSSLTERLGVAIVASLAVILSAPFSQQLFTEVSTRWPAQSRPIGIGASLVPAAIALLLAVRRIRDRYLLRYLALTASVTIAAAYILVSGLSFGESFHFIEYGLLGLLFYRVWRRFDDVAVLLLPVLAGTIAGTLDEWLQWFIPLRAGEARDVGLNVVALGCGLLFAIAFDPPDRVALTLRRESRRTVAAVAAAVLIVFALFLRSVHAGYEIVDPSIGTFVSRYTAAELSAVRDARAAQWRGQPPLVLRRLSREDQYLSEGMFHVQWRNRMWTEGNVPAAWQENRILETYYAPVLDTPSYISASGHRWPAEQRADAAARADVEVAGRSAEVAGRLQASGQPYVSEAYPLPMYTGPWPSTLLVLKLLLVPSLVVAVTLAVRRWGPAIGGWLSGLPIVAGPVLVFYAVEQGTPFAAEAAQATLAGMSATAAFSLAYAHLCLRARWPVAVAISWSVFAVSTLLLCAWQPGLWAGLALTLSAAIIGWRLLPRAQAEPGPAVTPRADLAVRVLASASMVLVLTALADQVGPVLSGLFSAFPILTTTMAAFTQTQRGPAAVVAFFRGFLPAIVGFSVFCFVFSLAVPAFGTAAGVTAALATQLVVHGAILKLTLWSGC